MKVTLFNHSAREVHDYLIKFWHTLPEKNEAGFDIPRNTTAMLFRIRKENENDFKDEPLEYMKMCGVAIPHVLDSFEKKVGRKVALRKLLDKMTEKKFKLTKPQKALIWEIYFKEHKK